MKTIIFKIALLLPALMLCLTLQAQVDLDAEDYDYLDPYDDNGDKWFEDIQDRRDFVNSLITEIKLRNVGGIVSIKDDVFVASIRTDDDLEYDNKNYLGGLIVKNTITQTLTTVPPSSTIDPNYYRIHFFIGANMTQAKIIVDSEVPAAESYWSESFANDVFTLELIQVDALRSTWLELVPPLQSTLNTLELTGY